MQVIAAISAGVSGVISLILGTYSNEEDIARLFSGSSGYLSLRDKIYMLFLHPEVSSDSVYQELSKLHEEYYSLDRQYSQYFSDKPYSHHFSGKRSKLDWFVRSSRLRYLGYLIGMRRYRSSQPPPTLLQRWRIGKIDATTEQFDKAIKEDIDNLNKRLGDQ